MFAETTRRSIRASPNEEAAQGRGVLIEEQGQAHMADNDGDSDEARAPRPLQTANCTYRIAFGPRNGQKDLTVQGTMPSATDLTRPCMPKASTTKPTKALRWARWPPLAGFGGQICSAMSIPSAGPQCSAMGGGSLARHRKQLEQGPADNSSAGQHRACRGP